MHRVFGDLDALRFVDGRLEPDRKAAFLAHLAEDPVETERVATWNRQNETLRAAFAGVALESIPPALRLGNVLPVRPAFGARPVAQTPVALHPSLTRLPPAGQQAGPAPAGIEPATIAYLSRPRGAARRPDLRLPLSIATLLGLAMLIVYVAHGLLTPAATWRDEPPLIRPVVSSPTLASRAGEAFVTYALDPVHPVEFTATQTGQLSHWLKRRLGVAIEPADLSTEGWTLLGGRLVTGLDGPSAFFVYEDRGGERLGLMVSPVLPGPASGAYLAASDAGPVTLSWSTGTFAYVIASGHSLDWLSRNGEALREHIGRARLD